MSTAQNNVEGFANFENWTDCQRNHAPSEPQYHPLLAPIILNKVLRYVDSNTIRNCRLVCRIWRDEVTEASSAIRMNIYAPSDAEKVLNEIKMPYAILPSRYLKLSNVQMDDSNILNLLETLSDNLRTVELNVDLRTFVLLNMPSWFQQVVTLIITESCDTYSIPPFADLFVPKIFTELWINPFPNLRHLKMQQRSRWYNGELDKGFSNLAVIILSKAKNIVTLDLLKTSSNNLDIITSYLARSPYILNRLTSLVLTSHNDYLSRWGGIQLNIKKLSIARDLNGCSTKTLERILHNTSASLEILEFYNNSNQLFAVTFSSVMKRLKIISLEEVTVHSVARFVELFELLPEVRKFELYLDNLEITEEKPRDHFWNGLFPITKENEKEIKMFSHFKLMELALLTCLTNPAFVVEIRKKLCNLKTLILEIDAKMLPVLIKELKDSYIEDFQFSYKDSTAENVAQFTAALTGISEKDCCLLLENEPYNQMPNVKNFKHESSLADWKNLKKLLISYKTEGNGVIELDWIVISQCFCLCTNITNLHFRHFEIEKRLVKKLLKKLPLLNELKFKVCKLKTTLGDYGFAIDNTIIEDLDGIHFEFTDY